MLNGINQATRMASLVFSKLDTKNQGYIEKSDLATAFSQISSKSSNNTSVDDVFTALDSNSDGKVTESEFSSVLSKLQEQLDSQRMQGHGGPHGMGGKPPPPPADDAGFTKDELTQQLSEADSTDSTSSSLLSKIVDNFEAADSNGDGKVSFQEAMAYDQSAQGSTASDSSNNATSATAADNSDLQIMKKIMQLMHAYGSGQEQPASGIATLLSVSA